MEKSKGLGDSISKITHKLRLNEVAYYVAKLAGAEGCGCEERQQYLNELFPYTSTKRTFVALEDFNNFDDIYEKGKKYTFTKENTPKYLIEWVSEKKFREIL